MKWSYITKLPMVMWIMNKLLQWIYLNVYHVKRHLLEVKIDSFTHMWDISQILVSWYLWSLYWNFRNSLHNVYLPFFMIITMIYCLRFRISCTIWRHFLLQDSTLSERFNLSNKKQTLFFIYESTNIMIWIHVWLIYFNKIHQIYLNWVFV